jgi:hypothetical protein
MSKLSFNRDRRSTSHFKTFSSFQKVNSVNPWTARRRNNFSLEQLNVFSMKDQYSEYDISENNGKISDFTNTS